MSLSTFCSLLFFIFSVAAAGAILHLLYFRRSGSSRAGNREALEALNIPQTIAERRRLMAQDRNDETLNKIKLAAKLSTERPSLSYSEALFKRAGVAESAERTQFQRKAVLSSIGGAAILALLGAASGLTTTIFVAAGIGALCGAAAPVLLLKTRADVARREIVASLDALMDPLKLTLERGLDTTSTVKELIKNAAFHSDTDPVLLLLQTALDYAEQGEKFSAALRKSAAESGVDRLIELCGILAMVDEQGAGWQLRLTQLRETLRDDHRLFKQRGEKMEQISIGSDTFKPRKR